jgi:hypothetical protein
MDGGSEAKVLIDPLPSNFSFDLPGAIGDMEFQLPDIVDISGNMDLTSLISSATLMVNNIVLLSSRLTVAFLENIGGISQEVKFDYILQEGETLDILGYFRKGDTSDLRKVHWVHGISLSQGLSEGTVGMEGKMYFQGTLEYHWRRCQCESFLSGLETRTPLALDRELRYSGQGRRGLFQWIEDKYRFPSRHGPHHQYEHRRQDRREHFAGLLFESGAVVRTFHEIRGYNRGNGDFILVATPKHEGFYPGI